MITRLWHGYTRPEDADTYQEMLLRTILPGIHRIAGYRGSYVLRKDSDDEVEFITLTFWESMDAIRAFAGPSLTKAVIVPEAEKLLTRYDERSTHYTSFRSD
jgi:heme-degrading monooxygenase HmoA